MVSEEVKLNDVTAVNRVFSGANSWWVEYAGRLPGGTFYNADEWDLTVTMKRKPRPFKAGDRVKTMFRSDVVTIDAVSSFHGTGEDLECWIRLPDGSHVTYEARNLTHAPCENGESANAVR